MVNAHICISVLVFILSIIYVEFSNRTRRKHPDAALSIEQVLLKHGYPSEKHEVTTEDGYILTLHRIPHGRTKTQQRRTPVLFVHGFMQSASNFINLGPDNALGFLLADNGYDVWLGNTRGSTWSRNHTVLNPNKDAAFWDFSFHEIGLYDIPAFVDYILKITKEDSLHYVGYSQGTSSFFTFLSEKPQYTMKIKHMTALAPAIFVQDPRGPILILFMYFRHLLEIMFEVFKVREIFARDGLVAQYLQHVCDENSMFVNLCLHHIFMIHGYSDKEVNKTILSLVFSNTPAGASPKQMMHLVQLMESGSFRPYDLGVKGNIEKYGQIVPPSYNLSKVTTPIALYYSSNDWTININNIGRLVRALPNVVKKYHVPLETFNHNDFVHAKNAVNLLYDAVIEEIMKY